MNQVWSKAEKDFLRANAAILKDVEVAAALSRLTGRHVSLFSVRQARLRLGIKKKHGRGVCAVDKRSFLPRGGIALVLAAE